MILERLKHMFSRTECKHDWEMEGPTTNVGGALMIWDGPIYDYCKKCGERRVHPECEHNWEPAEDDGQGIIINGKKTVRVTVCSKCGSSQYEVPK